VVVVGLRAGLVLLITHLICRQCEMVGKYRLATIDVLEVYGLAEPERLHS
jgi:hypothetical protein